MAIVKTTICCDKCAELTRPKTPYRIQFNTHTTDSARPIKRGYYASEHSYNRLMRVLESRHFSMDRRMEKYGFASAAYRYQDNTITTYEKPSQAYNVLVYGFKPIITHVLIRNYSLRQMSRISVSSRKRIQRLLDKSDRHLSDSGLYWFKTVYYS